jgi:hypothetical protein
MLSQGMPYPHLSPIGGVPGAWPVNPGGPPPPRGMFSQQLQQQRQNKGGMGPGRGGQYKQQYRTSPRNNVQGGGFVQNRSALGAADDSTGGVQESADGLPPAEGAASGAGEGVRRNNGEQPVGSAESSARGPGQNVSGQFNRRGAQQGQPYQGAASANRSARSAGSEQTADDEANQKKRQSTANAGANPGSGAGSAGDKQGSAAAKKKDGKRNGNKAGGDESAGQSGENKQQSQKSTSPSNGAKTGGGGGSGDQKRSPRANGDQRAKKNGGRQGAGGAEKKNAPGFNLDDADFPTWVRASFVVCLFPRSIILFVPQAENSVVPEKSPSGGLGGGEKGKRYHRSIAVSTHL